MQSNYGESTKQRKLATEYKETYIAKIDLSTEHNGKRTKYKKG